MGRKKNKSDAAVVANGADVAANNPGKPVDASEVTSLVGDTKVEFAHKPAGDKNADLPTQWIKPEEFHVEDDARTLPAANQPEIDRALAVNIFIYGQKQPAIAYRGDTDDRLIGVTGHTRARAVKLIREGFEAIDPRTDALLTFHDPDRLLWVAVDKSKTKEDAFIDGLITNIKQNALTPVQEGYAVKRLTERHGYSLTEAAKLFGYNNTNRQAKLLKLLELEGEVIDRVHAGELSLDAAVSTAGLKSEKRLKLISGATGDDGKVDPLKLRNVLRDVYSKGNEEVKNILDPQYGYSTEPSVPTGAGGEQGDDEGEGGKGSKSTKKKGRSNDDTPQYVARKVSDLKKFVEEQVEDDATPTPVRELFGKLLIWFTGEVGDRSLWNTIDATVKQK